jgi:hypothetical protein
MVSGSSRPRIVVLGYIVRGPLGGLCWHHLQYMIGLVELGHDVLFVEDSDDYEACYDPSTDQVGTDPSYGLDFTERTFSSVGLAGLWAYWDNHAGRWHGPAAERALEHCRTADLVLNLSGVNPLREWVADAPHRALVDTDPVFTQIRHLTDDKSRRLAEAHNSFLSFGENIGLEGCTVPDDGFPWRATRQPVALGAWKATPGPKDGRFTTVMQWDSYPAREHEGRRFGMKSASFGPYEELPRRTGRRFELALGSRTAPRDKLRELGWELLDPREPTLDPWSYQEYIRGSKAEFTVAKHGYVASWSGWFSERTAAYLASGRPVIVEDSGFTRWLERDAGVLPFTTPEGAIERIEALDRDYEYHCREARRVAEDYFDAAKVLPPMIEAAMKTAGDGASGR